MLDLVPLEWWNVHLNTHKSHVAHFGLWAGGIIGPYFFKNDDGRHVTVNGARYRAIISDFLLPEIEAWNLDDIWFQQDGALAIQLLKQWINWEVISKSS